MTDDILRSYYDADVISPDCKSQGVSGEPLPSGVLFSAKYLEKINSYTSEYEAIKIEDNYFEAMTELLKEIGQIEGQKEKEREEKAQGFYCRICDREFQNEAKHYSEIVRTYIHHLTPSGDWESSAKERSMDGPVYDEFKRVVGDEIWNWKPLNNVKPDPFWNHEDWTSIKNEGADSCKNCLVNGGRASIYISP